MHKRLRFHALVASLLLSVPLLSGCGQNVAGVQTLPAPKTAMQGVFEAETAFDVVLKQAGLYAGLKVCGTPDATPICSTKANVASLYALGQKGVQAIGIAKIAALAVDTTAAPDQTTQQRLTNALNGVVSVTTSVAQLLATLPKE